MFQLPHALIVSYLERRKSDVSTLEKSLLTKELEPFNRIGHQIAGNARSFGFDELEEIGLQMEKLTLADFEIKGRNLLSSFKSWVERATHNIQTPSQ